MSTYHKILVGLVALAYFISPLDLIPDLFIPYFGRFDDIFIVGLIIYYIKNGRLPGFFYRKTKDDPSGTGTGFRFSRDASFRNGSSADAQSRGNQDSNQGAASSRSRQNRHGRGESSNTRKNSRKQESNQGRHGNDPRSHFHETPHSAADQKKEKVRSPYEVLGINPGAGKDEIVAAYRKSVKEYHPDRVAHLGKDLQKLANQRFIEIRRAYNELIG